MFNLEFFVNLWTNTILPTFSTIIDTFTTPFREVINKNIDIPGLNWIINAIVSLFPNITLLEFILGSAAVVVIIVWVIKFFIGAFTGR